MQRISFFSVLSLIILLTSCNENQHKEKKQIQIVKQYNYIIDIEVWNTFAGDKVKYLLNNKRIKRYDFLNAKIDFPKPLTLYKILYVLEHDKENSNLKIFVPKDTVEVPFSKAKCDRLLDLTLQFLQSVRFNVYDTAVNGTITKPVIFDDSQGRIGLSYGGKRVDVTISSVNNPSIGTEECQSLLQFVHSQSSEPN